MKTPTKRSREEQEAIMDAIADLDLDCRCAPQEAYACNGSCLPVAEVDEFLQARVDRQIEAEIVRDEIRKEYPKTSNQ